MWNLDAAGVWAGQLAEMEGRVAALMLCVLGLSAVMRRASAAARCAGWVMALCGVLAIPLLTAVLPAWPVLPAQATRSPQSAAVTGQVLPGREDDTGAAERGGVSQPTTPGAVAPVRRPWSAASALVLLWLAGCVTLSARLVTWRVVAALRQRWTTAAAGRAWDEMVSDASRRVGLRRPARLRLDADRTMPRVCGVLRPTVVLPADAAGWSRRRRELVLLHELAHVARRDCLTQLLAEAACCVHWVNPLVWIAAQRLAAQRERACDDRVLLAGHEGVAYAEELLEVARTYGGRAPAASPSLPMARRSTLETRVRAILDPGGRRGPVRRRLVAAGAVMVAAVAAAVSCADRSPPRAGEGGTVAVSGRCVTATGEPAASVEVTLIRDTQDGAEPTRRTARTATDGGFRFEGVETDEDQPASVTVIARVPGRAMAWGSTAAHRDTTMDLRLGPTMTIGGIVSGHGAVLAGASVRVIFIDRDPSSPFHALFVPVGTPPWTTQTDVNGAFELPDVPADAWATVIVRHPRWAMERYDIRAGTEGDIHLEQGGTIVGRLVFEEGGAPAVGVRVAAGPRRGYAFDNAVTDAEGRYRLGPLPDGEYYVIAYEPEGYTSVAVESLRVARGQATAPDLVLVRGGFIAGEVTDEADGRPVKPGRGSRVYIYGPSRPRNGQPLSSGPIDAEGRFRVRVAPGRNFLYLQAPEDDWRGGSVDRVTVTVAAGQTVAAQLTASRATDTEKRERDVLLSTISRPAPRRNGPTSERRPLLGSSSNPGRVLIHGDVPRPGTYAVDGLYLHDLLVAAGVRTPESDEDYLIRVEHDRGLAMDPASYEMRYRDVMTGGTPLLEGDTIRVTKAPRKAVDGK